LKDKGRRTATDTQLAVAAGLPASLARYHLTVLCDAELIAPSPCSPGVGQSYEIRAER